jgi:hypothetical protein
MSALTGMTTGDPAGVGPEITVQALAERRDGERRILPGVLRSSLRGGRFDGGRVVSESGPCGDATPLPRPLALDEAKTSGKQA